MEPQRGPIVSDAHEGRPPRLAPVPPSARTDAQRELLARVDVQGPMGEANIFTTLVRAPGVFRRWLSFGGALLRGALPARDRELLILRTAVNCAAPYEWGQHVRLGAIAGLTDDEIARVARGWDAAGWGADDAVLLRVADELHETCMLSDERWDELAARYDDEQLIEILMLVGHYHLVAMTLNALRVANDEGLAPLPG
jgi:alkylhydroperoxidase family enzyme